MSHLPPHPSKRFHLPTSVTLSLLVSVLSDKFSVCLLSINPYSISCWFVCTYNACHGVMYITDFLLKKKNLAQLITKRGSVTNLITFSHFSDVPYQHDEEEQEQEQEVSE